MKRLIVICSLLAAGCSKSSDGTKDSRGACERGVADCSADATCADVETSPGFTCTCNAGFTGDGVTCTVDPVDHCAAGAEVAFEKTDYGSEQDCITPDVCLTRGDSMPIYNAAVEDGWPGSGMCGLSLPSDTLWAWGACADAALADFGPFLSGAFLGCENASSVVDAPACLQLVSEHRFFDITFTSWTQNGEGGGFAYSRTEYNPCGPGATCTNTSDAYTCACPDGYTFDGTTCVDVDECAVETSPCDAGTTCVNQVGTYACFTCAPGYYFDGEGCSDIDECGYGFAKEDYGTEMDWIAPSVLLARLDSGPIFNAIVDPGGATGYGSEVPTGTLWALGTCDAVAEEDFGPFLSSSFADGSPQSVVDADACLWLPEEDQRYEVVVSSWTGGGNGGGFSYTRAAYCGIPGTVCQNTDGAYDCVPQE